MEQSVEASGIALTLWGLLGVVLLVMTVVLVVCWRDGRAALLARWQRLRRDVTAFFVDQRRRLDGLRRPFVRAYARAVRRRERAVIAQSVVALEGRFARLLQRDLAQLPDLRQYAQDTLKRVEEGFAIDERRMLEEPAWVLRLESLAKVPASVALQGEKLARDIEETLLRIARLGLEEHQQQARLLLEERRRSEPLLFGVVKRLEAMQRELHQLGVRARELDQRLARFFTSRDVLRVDPVAQWSWISRGLIALVGLTLVGVALAVGKALFDAPFVGVFGAQAGENPWAIHAAMLLFAGAAALAGALLTDGLRAATWRAAVHFERDALRRWLSLVGGAGLAVLVLVAGWVGWSADWLGQVGQTVAHGWVFEVAPPALEPSAMLGATLGGVVVLIVATTAVWVAGFVDFMGLMLRALPVAAFSLLLAAVTIVQGLVGLVLVLLGGLLAIVTWPLYRHRARRQAALGADAAR